MSNNTFKVGGTDFESRFVKFEELDFPIPNVTNRQIWTWGIASDGQLGLDSTTNRSSPIQVGSVNTWGNFSSGSSSTAAITRAGNIFSWGLGTYGRLGLNNVATVSSPTQIGTDNNWSTVSGGRAHHAAIKTDGSMWSWGRGQYGALGHNSSINRSSPVQIGTEFDWYVIAPGNTHTAAIKRNGTLWTWGQANYGTLGLNTATPNRSSPVQVGTLSNWKTVSVWDVSIALKTDGTIWSWGRNLYGVLGLNNTTTLNVSSPVQIGTGSDWKHVMTKNFTALAIKTDGTLWGWGSNNTGQLGLNNRTSSSSPIQVGTDTNWTFIAVGPSNVGELATVAAIKTDGTLWTWGNGDRGTTAQNNQVDRSSPTQVGTLTNWKSISIGFRHAIASRLV